MTTAAAPSRSAAIFLLGTVLCFVVPPLTMGVLVRGAPGPGPLLAVTVAELLSSIALVAWWLRRHGLGRQSLGLTTERWHWDALAGAATVLPRLLLDLAVLIPASGGAANPEVQEVLRHASGGAAALAATLALGVIGGGIAEELYFRGFLLGSLPRLSNDRRRAVRVAAATSVLLFAGLHLPANVPDAIHIVLASIVYTGLFLWTGRLTAPVVAHALWNASATFAVIAVYG